MAVSRRVVGGITVLDVSGEFTGGDETDELRKAVLDEAQGGGRQLVLDLTGCNLMNSSGLSVLVEAYRTYAARHGEVKLCGLQPRMTNQLVTVRLINLLGRYASAEEAVAAFPQSRTGA